MLKTLLLATGAYAVLNLAFGLWKTRSDSYESFVGYRNRSPLWLVLLSINATFVGGGMFFATGEMGFKADYAPMVLALCTGLGLIAISFFAGRIRGYCDKAGALTLYDYLEGRLGRRDDAKIFTKGVMVVNIVLYFFLLAGQFLVLQTFFEAFAAASESWALGAAVSIVGLNTLIYGVVGGLKKDIWTDALQMGLVIAAAAVLAHAILSAPHKEVLAALPPATAPGDFGALFIVGALLFFSPAFLVRYDLWQRVLSSKTTATARWASWLSIPIVAGSYWLFVLAGRFARSVDADPESARFAVVNTMQHVLSDNTFVFVVLALFAAVMSSADTFLNIASTSLHRLAVGLPDKAERTDSLLQLRIMTIAVCVGAAILVIVSPSIVDLFVGAFSSLVITAPSLVYVIVSKNPQARAATISLVSGLLVFLVIFVTMPSLRTVSFIIATLVALIALGIGRAMVGTRAPA